MMPVTNHITAAAACLTDSAGFRAVFSQTRDGLRKSLSDIGIMGTEVMTAASEEYK